MTPAIEALDAGAAGKLTKGAGRRPEPPERRTGSKVRRSSWAPGRGGRRVKLTWAQRARRLWAFRKWQRRQTRKAKGKIRGVGYIGEAVFEYLLNEAVRRAGALDHLALERIAAVLGYSKSAVVAAIGRLKLGGWLDWVRTFRDTGRAGVRGPQVEQGINSYWICVPDAELAKLGIPGVDPPVPDDEAERAKAQARADTPATDPDNPLARALAAADRAIARRAQRESDDRSDSTGMSHKSASGCAGPQTP